MHRLRITHRLSSLLSAWRQTSFWRAHILAVAVALAAFAITYGVDRLREAHTFGVFFGAVLITLWLGGLRPALTALAVSILLYLKVIFPKIAADELTSSPDLVRLAVGLIVIAVAAALNAQRERAEEAYRKLEFRINAALESAQMGTWEYDFHDRKFWWSRSLEVIVGERPGLNAPTDRGFRGYIDVSDPDFLLRAKTQPMDDGLIFEIEHEIVRPEGTIRRIFTRGRLFWGDNSEPTKIYGIAADVTEDPTRSLLSDDNFELIERLHGLPNPLFERFA